MRHWSGDTAAPLLAYPPPKPVGPVRPEKGEVRSKPDLSNGRQPNRRQSIPATTPAVVVLSGADLNFDIGACLRVLIFDCVAPLEQD